MLEAKTIKNDSSSIDIIKGLGKETLFDYAKEYLTKHSYLSSKRLSTSYLYEQYNITYRNRDYIELNKSLSHKFRHTIMLLNRARLIVGYNNSSLYKRVDIDKSLSG